MNNNWLCVNDQIEVEVNQGIREARVLAVVADEALIEYRMPKGSSALRIIRRTVPFQATISPIPYKSISYRNVPKKFLNQMIDNGVQWEGHAQGHFDMDRLSKKRTYGQVPSPVNTLKVR